jgi:hypothetical protein
VEAGADREHPALAKRRGGVASAPRALELVRTASFTPGILTDRDVPNRISLRVRGPREAESREEYIIDIWFMDHDMDSRAGVHIHKLTEVGNHDPLSW